MPFKNKFPDYFHVMKTVYLLIILASGLKMFSERIQKLRALKVHVKYFQI